MKKRKIIVFLVLFITVILTAPFVIVVNWHLQMTDFKEGTVGEYDSYDGLYTIRLLVEEDDYIKLHYNNVSLLDNSTKVEVFSIKNEFRAFDFHWIVWENESYNFWLKSGDMGTFYYELQSDNKTWIKYGVVKVGKKYYRLRADMGKVEKWMDIGEIKKRLPEGYDLD